MSRPAAWALTALGLALLMPEGASAGAPGAQEHEERTAPLRLTVDCEAGQTVGGALARAADHPGALEVAIQGLCAETVRLSRDDVTLRGVADGDGLQAPAGAAQVLLLDGARNVVLERLTVDGNGFAGGLLVTGGSSVLFDDLTVREASPGVTVDRGSRARVRRARILARGEPTGARDRTAPRDAG